ncbi:MAG: hypothetical protein RIM84_13150 [Alphaproteobacteria bacterium]
MAGIGRKPYITDMRRMVAGLRRHLPAAVAVAVGAGVGLAAAGAAAQPLGEAWQVHVLPAFSRLLTTFFYC